MVNIGYFFFFETFFQTWEIRFLRNVDADIDAMRSRTPLTCTSDEKIFFSRGSENVHQFSLNLNRNNMRHIINRCVCVPQQTCKNPAWSGGEETQTQTGEAGIYAEGLAVEEGET